MVLRGMPRRAPDYERAISSRHALSTMNSHPTGSPKLHMQNGGQTAQKLQALALRFRPASLWPPEGKSSGRWVRPGTIPKQLTARARRRQRLRFTSARQSASARA